MMQSQPKPDSEEPDALDAIRNMLAQEPAITAGQPRAPSADDRDPGPKRSLLKPFGQAEKEPQLPAEAAVAKPARAARTSKIKLPKIKTPKIKTPKARTPRAEGRLHPLLARAKAYRPTAKHVIWASLALLVILRPWLVLGVVVLTLLVVTISILTVGAEAIWHKAQSAFCWYATRRPAHATRLRARLDALAVRWDALLDRFPETWVQGLYLPDFNALAEADRRHAEAVEMRLDRLGQS